MPNRPTPGSVEQRSAPDVAVEGRRLRGVIPYGVESRDLGGWREVMAAGSLAAAKKDDLVATVDHSGVPLARFPTTLEVEDRADGLHWSLDLPESRADVREAVERGDLRSASWRMVVARERWDGNVRHVLAVDELRDVSVVTLPAYSEARAEYRAAPDSDITPGEREGAADIPNPPEEATVPEVHEGGGLKVEDRAAVTSEPAVEERVLDAIRTVKKGEARSLATTNAAAITPDEISTFLFDRLRSATALLASGVRVIPTDRDAITFPKLSADMTAGFFNEGQLIAASDPTLVSVTATPRKLAARVELTNEVIDDSEPDVIDILENHIAAILGLRLDLAGFEGSGVTPEVRGLKNVPGIQAVSMGANGAPVTNYDPLVRAVGLLRSANVPGPYAAVMHPDVLTQIELLKDAQGAPLPRPDSVPPIFTTSQLATTETQGTATNARSIYVYAPAQLAVVRRKDAAIELDRSRLFNQDMSEMRGVARADLLVPNPVAVVRIVGVTP